MIFVANYLDIWATLLDSDLLLTIYCFSLSTGQTIFLFMSLMLIKDIFVSNGNGLQIDNLLLKKSLIDQC